MARTASFFCLVVALITGVGWIIGGARAQGVVGDPFSAFALPVDATAEDATTARALALAAGQVDGLRQVLEQLTAASDHGRLPAVDQALASRLLASYGIVEERISSTRYRALLNLRFKAEGVRELLRSAGIPFTEVAARPSLVLPVLTLQSQALLWEESNPWLAAWRDRAHPNALVPLVAPVGDLDDMGSLSPTQALAGDSLALAAMARRYGTNSAVVALAALEQGEGGVAGLDIEVRQSPPTDEALRLRIAGEPGEDPAALYIRAVVAVEQALADQWKTASLAPTSRIPSLLVVDAAFANLEDWMELRQRLASQPAVTGIEVVRLSARAAEMTLHFVGDPVDLQSGLQRAGLELVTEMGKWRLRLLRAGAQLGTLGPSI